MIHTFNRTNYGKEHKLVIKARTKPKIAETQVLDFNEEFEHYKSMCKKAFWRTEAGFSLEWNTSLDILKQCYFVYPNNEIQEKVIKQKLKIIEEQ